MHEAAKWHEKRWVRVFIAALGVIMAVLWWRMGGIEVQVHEGAQGPPWAEEGYTEFSVLTYNVQARPYFDRTREKFTRMSPLLNRFDIVGLQEAFKDHRRVWREAEHETKVYHSRLKHPFKIVGSGLSNLGKFPLLAVEGLNFDALGEFQNRPASKGVLMTRFDVHGMILDVYNTHIEAGRSAEALQAKADQATEIIAFVRRHSPAAHSVIFAGDWNMRPSRGPEDREENKDNPRVTAFDRIVRELEFKDASDEVVGPTRTDIDRILFRAGTGHLLEVHSWQKDHPDFYFPGGEPLSDHDPVFATFRLGPREP